MLEKEIDLSLGIRTTGIREWKDEDGPYHRYEATPYQALDKLFKAYTFHANDRLVDFGCGRGRVSFYIHYHFQIPVSGVENNDKTFDELLKNEEIYLRKHRHIEAPLYFEFGLAENYEIQPTETVFYFFNPFSLKIYKKVVNNILKSVEEHERSVDLIFYYPLSSFKHFMRSTSFALINKVEVPEVGHGKHGKFLIYRLQP